MDKFNRNYELKVQGDRGSIITITLPFTIEIDITRNTLTSANICQVRIFNLAPKTRNQIRFNQTDYGQYKQLQLRAGYGSDIPIIFSGNISQAWSVREGTNMITQIECLDGGFAFNNGVIDMSFPAGTPNREVISSVMDHLPNVQTGAIGDYPGTLGRGATYSGSPVVILSQLTNGGFFVDLEKANALGTNEYIDNTGGVRVINASSGLIGTPLLEYSTARAEMIFEPGLNVGQRIKLESTTEQNFNGFYKVTAIKHRGMISDALCGRVTTTAEFFFTKQLIGVQE